MVDIWSAGNYGSEEDRTRRLARPLCFLRHDPTDNGYVRPIEGLRPVVDLNTMQVIRVEEYGQWPLPPAGELCRRSGRASSAADIKPLEITQPEGPSFEVEGHQVRWQKWSFVIGFNAREGLTLHHLRYRRQRPRALDPLSRVADRDGGAVRRPRPDRSGARTPSTSANTAWACARTAWSWAAIASG